MDHGGHGGMDYGGHGGMDMPMQCSMNMLWNSQVRGTCVVFSTWRIQTWWGMVVSCLAIITISLLYSLLLHRIKQSDRRTAIAQYLLATGQGPQQPMLSDHPASPPSVRASVSVPGRAWEEGNGVGGVQGRGAVGPVGMVTLPMRVRVERAGYYALTVAISYFLMLVAMTYNTYLCTSIVVGAFIGHLVYEAEMDVTVALTGSTSKGLACH